MQDTCYWCGAPATSDDHIPPKGFYPKELRKNLIKVPSCAAHNEEFHLLDERMRYYIQATSEGPVAEQAFADATLRGLLKPKAAGFLKAVVSGMKPALVDGVPGVSAAVGAGDVERFSERLARGIHFRHFKSLLIGKVYLANTHIVHANVDNVPGIKALEEMSPHLTAGDPTDDKVFRYWYGKTIEPGGQGFLMKAVFYETVGFYVMSVDC
jgi:hypothetical protein